MDQRQSPPCMFPKKVRNMRKEKKMRKGCLRQGSQRRFPGLFHVSALHGNASVGTRTVVLFWFFHSAVELFKNCT